MNQSRLVLLSLVIGLGAPLAHADAVKVSRKIPYAHPEDVREAIKKECSLEEQLGQFLVDQAGKSVQAVDSVKGAKGTVLDLEITGVWAGGGPWGAASVLVEGVLREGSRVVGSVRARRNTTRGGGACSKLEVSARAVAKDIAGWLENPTMDAKLGDVK